MSFHKSAKVLDDKLPNVFSDAGLLNAFAEFDKRKSPEGRIGRVDFAAVLKALFDDRADEQVEGILRNALLLDRIFAFLDVDKKDSITAEQLERLALVFSPDQTELAKFRFFVYDTKNQGHITAEDVVFVLWKCFETAIVLRGEHMRKLQESGQVDADSLARFEKTKAHFNGQGRSTVDTRIKDVVARAFREARHDDVDKLTLQEFLPQCRENDDYFDWRGISEDLCDLVDDYARLL